MGPRGMERTFLADCALTIIFNIGFTYHGNWSLIAARLKGLKEFVYVIPRAIICASLK